MNLSDMPTTEIVARLRRLAAELTRRARDGESLRRQIGNGSAPPPLSEAVRRSADFITANPGRTGEEISQAAGIEWDTFRKHHVPKLRAHGFREHHRPRLLPAARRDGKRCVAPHTSRGVADNNVGEMYTSGPTPVGTSGPGNFTLISVPAGGLYNHLTIENEGAQDGLFSVDGGTNWAAHSRRDAAVQRRQQVDSGNGGVVGQEQPKRVVHVERQRGYDRRHGRRR